MSPPATPTPPAHDQARILAEAPVLDLQRIPWGSNAVFQARLGTEWGEQLAIYKPARGERPLWDFPNGSLHRREVAAAAVDRALGWDLLPETVLRNHAPLGVGSMQEYVYDPPADLVLDRAGLERSLRRLAVFDVVVNNADRKRAHLLTDTAGRLKAIDHGVTFHTEFKLRTALLELGGSEVDAEDLAALRSMLDHRERMSCLRRNLKPLLRSSEIEAFERRARRLLKEGVYPRLHDWYGRPFEW